jgi:hypothetical protein
VQRKPIYVQVFTSWRQRRWEEQLLVFRRTIKVEAHPMPPSPNDTFPASYDSTTRVISLAVCGVLAAVVLATRSVLVGCLSALIPAAAYAYSPRAYAIRERSIVVKRLIGSVRIPLDAIRELRAATADDFRGCLRLWGNGGLFGYYGLFQTSKLGKCTWYVTNRSHAVVLITDTQTVVLSPDDVDGFLTAMHTAAPVARVQAGQPLLDSMRSYGSGSLAAKLAGVGIACVVLALLAFAMLYSPGPPSVTMTAESLTIHDRFYPATLSAAGVDMEHIRVVDFGVDGEWRPTARTNGFANAHYRSGWFRVASGKTVRMYQADSRRLVLLPPRGAGTAVLLETKEPAAFIEELRRKWTRSRAIARRDDKSVIAAGKVPAPRPTSRHP